MYQKEGRLVRMMNKLSAAQREEAERLLTLATLTLLNLTRASYCPQPLVVIGKRRSNYVVVIGVIRSLQTPNVS